MPLQRKKASSVPCTHTGVKQSSNRFKFQKEGFSLDIGKTFLTIGTGKIQRRAVIECAAIKREACNKELNESLSGMALDLMGLPQGGTVDDNF